MYSKIIKPDKKPITDLERDIDKAVIDIQKQETWAAALKNLFICEAKELIVGKEKAIVIYVPVPQLRSYQRIHKRLVGELEKKMSGTHVVICAFRRILPKPRRNCKSNPKQKRPRSRTLTSVHDNILRDLVYPAEIVGKRIQKKVDGNTLIKCHLDLAQRNDVEHKIPALTGLYKRLTGKDVQFEFPEWVL
ncbi:40S ribosomal protein [Cichlidogyrus casuarinus]|uniref:40S ribosomal protein S7 n=1 Tax=Cichlidogyrus casuarinus TaxID=1844966 RepID=A0ABD2QAA1_9PLAT